MNPGVDIMMLEAKRSSNEWLLKRELYYIYVLFFIHWRHFSGTQYCITELCILFMLYQSVFWKVYYSLVWKLLVVSKYTVYFIGSAPQSKKEPWKLLFYFFLYKLS